MRQDTRQQTKRGTHTPHDVIGDGASMSLASLSAWGVFHGDYWGRTARRAVRIDVAEHT